MSDDVVAIVDRSKVYDDGTVVQVRVLSVPDSDTYPRGIKYGFHYGRTTGTDEPVIRFDNHHGDHELHIGDRRYVLDEFPGFDTIGRCFVAALPAAKRDDWSLEICVRGTWGRIQMTTLRITVGSDEPAFDGVEETLEALDEGEDVEPADEIVLAVESLGTLARILRETNLELLEAIAEHDPQSMRETARLVDRSIPQVKANLDELETYGLLRYEENGRAKRPVLPYDDIRIDARVPLGQGDDGEHMLA